MGKHIDLTNQQFGKWIVLKKDLNRVDSSGHYTRWLCRCSCGNPEIRSVDGYDLRKGRSTSCGKCPQFEMIGKIFGRLTVIDVDRNYVKENGLKSEEIHYRCQCSCKNKNIITVSGTRLRNGTTMSCGCYNKERIRETHMRDLSNQIFGYLQPLYPTEKRNSGNSIIWHCKCLLDNNECDVAGNSLTQGKTLSCGCLGSSAGEKVISSILDEAEIVYEKEKTFEDLINPNSNRKYRYDFYLPDYNRLIEFDGIQHFEGKNHFGGQEEYQKRSQSDTIKNEYALSHNIELIRIPYWERDNITLEMLLGKQYLIVQ